MITKEQFSASILPFTLRFESGYVNDPDDSGGETYRGISRQNNPSWSGWDILDQYKLRRGDIINNAELNKAVSELYFKEYFEANQFQQFDSVLVALMCFDFAVHGGYSDRKLQTVLNEKFKTHLVVDGNAGIKTFAAANLVLEADLSNAILDVRKARFALIIENDSTQEKYREGWDNRIAYLRALIKKNKK